MNKNNFPHKISKRNMVFSAHSMSTSFYALHNGTLVEFETGSDGIIPYGYPAHDEIADNLVQVIHECSNIPRIKQEMSSLKKLNPSVSAVTENQILLCEAASILGDFIYGYGASMEYDTSSFVNALLRGEIDESCNVYRYDLIDQPSITPPAKLISSIRSHLSSLPRIDLNATIIFHSSEVAKIWSDSPDPDLLLTKNLLPKVIHSPTRRNKFFKSARNYSKVRDDNSSFLLVSYPEIRDNQKMVLALTNPSFLHLLKEEKLICLSCSNRAPQSRAIIKSIEKICPQATIFFPRLPELATLLRKVFPEK